ncbi:class I SAM-dependent methyltransferase [Actinomadura macrotermitis]|uniref:Trans-aconitate 2-methyltransferase n=1 Tax=Actinomadura macrotermitis TaxID=2585200 RepID=A0A7K0BTY5_9ACTN|nr:class I SAM-dependent methyltransferase [Actinomadura macrotermitis]MQY04650.1 Trans-aconitate 2-methyltransferase [Actinomadura macrotermitis]
MPTTPSARTPLSEKELHRHRQVAEAFGSDPERYDRTRPSYPAALVDRITANRTGLDVVDVGCGTGISSRLFQAAGCTVLGVEPDARMAEFARRRGLAAEVATFETWEPSGRTFDAVVSGQSWHWLDAAAGAAKAAQVLRPGGRLAVFWNAETPPPELLRSFGEVYRRLLPDSLVARQWTAKAMDGYVMLCGKAADGMREAGAFGEPEEWRFAWEKSYTRDEWVDQLPTHGDHGQYPAAKVHEVQAGIGEAIDAVGGTFTMRYTTIAMSAVRASG